MTPQEAGKEYNRRLRELEYKRPERLCNVSVEDIVYSPEFSENLTAYINEQKMTRNTVLQTRKRIRESGKYPEPENRPTIDRIIEAGLMENASDFGKEYIEVINGKSKYPAEMRKYIHQLGTLAYRLTIEQIICKENPDMARLVKLSQSENEKKSNIRQWCSKCKWFFVNVYGRIKRLFQRT